MINSGTGAITVTGILDRELVDSYTLNVQAVDKGVVPRTGTLILTGTSHVVCILVNLYVVFLTGNV